MIKTSFRNIAAHKLRLALTVVTVALGIAFIAGTNIFTDSLKSSFDALVDQPRPDVSVAPRTALDDPTGGGGTAVSSDVLVLPETLVQEIQALPEVRVAVGRVVTEGGYVLGADGRPIGRQGPPARVANWTDVAQATVLNLFAGRPPQGPQEVALLQSTAQEAGYAIGDRVPITTPRDGVIEPELVGIVTRTLSGGLGGTLVVFDTETAQRYFLEPGQVSSIAVLGVPGVLEANLAQAVEAISPEFTTIRTSQQVADQTAERIEEGFTFLNTFLLAFGFLALFVATFLIFNTFSMLIAQRTRELALLRAIGATRRQVFASVLLEAAIVGALGAVIGLVGGVGLALGLRRLIDVFAGSLPAGPLVVNQGTIVLAAAVGVGVTVLASLLPARRASAIAPVAAMRVDAPIPERSLRRLTLFGVVLIIAAVPVIWWSLRISPDDAQGAATWLGIAALIALIGVLAATPYVARPLLGVLGAPIRGFITGKLATENARRNPRRTAATTSALAIGLAVMTVVTVIGTSARASVTAVVDRTVGADFIVLGQGFRPLDPGVYERLTGTPNADVVTYVRNVPADIGDERVVITGVEADVVDDVIDVQMTSGDIGNLALGNALIDDVTANTLGIRDGDTVDLALINGPGQVRIVGTYEPIGFLQGLLVTMPTLMSFGALERDTGVYIRAAQDADLGELRSTLEARLTDYPAVQIQDQADIKREVNQQFDILFGFVYALLALSILVAFLGIVNTLSLSVYERFREIGLLRAVGTTRAQLRRMVTLEAILIAVLGTTVGLVVGLIFGVAFQRILEPQGIAILAIPWPTLAAFVVLGVVGGMLAALWPAWRASRLSVLRAIATD
jgi:putative ABC transport system permease protein